MNKKVIGLLVLIMLVCPTIVLANAMEPPAVVIIVEGSERPEEVWMTYDDEVVMGVPQNWPLETQYWFRADHNRGNVEVTTLHIKWSDDERTYELKELNQYNNLFSVSKASTKLNVGKSIARTFRLVGFRLGLTLIIEGIIFLLFGFREKSSWIAFFVINVITQLALNLYINTLSVSDAYPWIALIFGEFWVFLGEGIALPIVVKEKTKLRRLIFVMTANLASLVIGSYLITRLPI